MAGAGPTLAAVLVSGVASAALVYIASSKLDEGLTALLKEVHALVAVAGKGAATGAETTPILPAQLPEGSLNTTDPNVAEAIASLSEKVDRLAESTSQISDGVWGICRVSFLLGIGASAIGAVAAWTWPKSVVKSYVRSTLLDAQAGLDDDPPELALSILYLQTFEYKVENGTGFSFKPLASLLSSLKLRHPEHPSAAVTALHYAICYKSEEDAMWLITRGATLDIESASLIVAISRRMYPVVNALCDALTQLSPEKAAVIVNFEVDGVTALSSLLDKPPTCEWSVDDYEVLSNLQELGVINKPVIRTKTQGAAALKEGQSPSRVTLEEIVNQTFHHPKDGQHKREVLQMLAELVKAPANISNDPRSHTSPAPSASRPDAKKRPATASTIAPPRKISDARLVDEESKSGSSDLKRPTSSSSAPSNTNKSPPRVLPPKVRTPGLVQVFNHPKSAGGASGGTEDNEGGTDADELPVSDLGDDSTP